MDLNHPSLTFGAIVLNAKLSDIYLAEMQHNLHADKLLETKTYFHISVDVLHTCFPFMQVVKYIVSSFSIVDSRDNQGNIALHIAAFRGHLSIVEALIIACPASSSVRNNAGDTFLHMAVAGFRTPGFRRLDRQMELMKQLVNGRIVNIQEVINIRNNDGRTALHVAVIGNMHTDLVELLMKARSIDLNIRDINGMTPLDLLSQRPRSASSEIVIKQLVSAGGIFSARDHTAISAIASQLRMQGIGSSPGTSFKVSDAEIFLYTGIEVSEPSGRSSSCSSSAKSEVTHYGEVSSDKKQNSVNRAANKLKILLRWPLRKEKKGETTPKKSISIDSMDSIKKWSEREDTPTPLRQRFSKTSLLNNKRTLAVRNSMPSPVTKKKFAVELMHGVIQAMPHLAPPPERSPSDLFSRSGMSTPTLEKHDEHGLEEEMCTASCSNSSIIGSSEVVEKLSQRPGFVNNKLMNQYFCFGAQGVSMEDSVSGQRRSLLAVA